MSEREDSQRERRATRAGGRPLAPGRLSEERAQGDPTERDRTLSRVRTTTAVTGIGAVVVGGALAGWLGHTATAGSQSTSDSSSSSSSTDSSSSSSDDGLSGSGTAPESGSSSSGSDSSQPGITSGGS
jgi:hypothetical protein